MIIFESKVKIKTKKDTETLLSDLKKLAKKRVLVGVPEENSERKDKVSNSFLAYIHDKGAPSVGIPARPFMKPGIEKVQGFINQELKIAATAQLDGTEAGVERALNNAGLIAQASIRNIIRTSEGFEPLKRATKLGRIRKRKSLKKKDKETREAIMDSLKPLIDTGELLHSITYVIEEDK